MRVEKGRPPWVDPQPADLESFSAMREWYHRVMRLYLPEAEFRQMQVTLPDGPPSSDSRAADWAGSAIMAGRKPSTTSRCLRSISAPRTTSRPLTTKMTRKRAPTPKRISPINTDGSKGALPTSRPTRPTDGYHSAGRKPLCICLQSTRCAARNFEFCKLPATLKRRRYTWHASKARAYFNSSITARPSPFTSTSV